ncbi:O-antigen ligase family protein [Rhodocyclus purpureus]|uniref:O-antigen ligase family protein n=1 Tax=Rhodocyclus purpureus TaxID=1067 RepID=UPI00191451C9|nr:O-antigen ligase family protein [Rhodocyclus purpureus]
MNSLATFFSRGWAFFSGRPAAVVTFIFLVLSCLLVSHYFRRFVFWFPLLLSVYWLVVVRRDSNMVRRFATLLPLGMWLALAGYMLSLLVASLISPSWETGVRELLLAVVSPVLIAVLAGRMTWPEGVERRVLLALVWSGGLLAATDVAHHITDLATSGQFASDFSHRWRATGFILFLPFLILFRDTLMGWRKVALNVGLLVFFLLAAWTGSRTAWGTIMLEIAFLGILTRQPRYFVDIAIFGFAIAIALTLMPHETGMASLERGLSDNNRINGHWLPAIQMSEDSFFSFLIGHGYGSEVVVPPQFSGQATPLLAGPHNVFLQAFLAGGLAALATLSWLFAELGRLFWRFRKHHDARLKRLAVGGGISFAGYFLIAGMVGDPRPEPLAMFMLVAMILYRYESAARLSSTRSPSHEIASSHA